MSAEDKKDWKKPDEIDEDKPLDKTDDEHPDKTDDELPDDFWDDDWIPVDIDGTEGDEEDEEDEEEARLRLEAKLREAEEAERRRVDQCTAQEVLDQLERFHLDSRTRRELAGLVEMLRHRRTGRMVKPVHYALLLQCGCDDYAEVFVQALSDALISCGLLDTQPVFLREGEHTRRPSPSRSGLRVVLGCRSLPASDKLANASTQERIGQATQRWTAFWAHEEELLQKSDLMIGVAIVSEAVIRSTWKRHEHLFYRVYGHHIFLDDVPVRDMQDAVFNQLTFFGLEMDEPFQAGLREYIRVVYPKADLKYNNFTKDLVNRILTAYYSAHTLERVLTRRCVPYYRQPKSFDDVISKLDGMVGMGPVREAFQELYYHAQGQGGKTPLRLNMAFVGNPGTGKTTVAKMAADLLYAMGLIQKPKVVLAKPSDLISPWVGQTAIQTRNVCRSAFGGVLFIDEAYTLTYSPEKRGTGGDINTTAQCVDTLLQEMEENANRLVVIFAGYPGPMERFLDSNEGLRSRVTRIIRFPDYTEEELLLIFQRICRREGFSVAEDAHEALRARIAFEKSGDNFGNARSVEVMFQNIRAEWQKDPGGDQVFTQAHIRAAMPEPRHSDIGSMIGLDDVKEQLRQFKRRVTYMKTVSEKGVKVPPMNLHMMFTGNPGTGKTTVAQAIADDLYQIGVLKTNKCVCIEARNLTTSWADAAQRMEREIQRAMGGVLFLDEAYALTEYASGNVGREVVASLITAMERYRGELVVIVAGYPANMRAFLSVNPGLASRIGFTFHFRDYDVRELTDIFLSKMQKCGYLLASGAAERVEALMEYFHVIPGFGNGRFVDNVIDQTITRRSLREEDDPCRYNEITEEDIPDVKAVLDTMPDGDRFWDPAKVTQEERRRTAVHEMGHALTSLLLEPDTKLDTISITEQALSAGRVGLHRSSWNLTENQLRNTISIALGGRGAERVVFGTHSTGCASDYQQAKAIARDMLEHYAMGPKLGAKEIAPLLNQANDVTMKLLTQYKDVLMELADQLLDQRTLTDEELRQYLSEHPQAEGVLST